MLNWIIFLKFLDGNFLESRTIWIKFNCCRGILYHKKNFVNLQYKGSKI